MSRLLLFALWIITSVDRLTSQPADCPQVEAIIPSVCDCTSPANQPNNIVIYCKGKQLTSMPNITGSYNGVIYEFTLADNDITYLPPNAFQGLNVQRVDITNNKLTNISDEAFQGLENILLGLKISGNAVNSPQIPFSAIGNLRGLQELLLQNFQPPAVDLEDSSYFQPFSNLLTLTLDNLGINSIGSSVFIGLTSLKEMNIRNFLNTYPGTAMRALRNTIEVISVTNTQIASVQFYSFDGSNQLKKIDFSYNRITLLEEDCFKGVENSLESLTLDNNNIPQSQLKEIGKLTALKVLSLQNVGVSSLTQNTEFLQNKTHLEELHLARNVLSVVPDNIFTNLNSLKKLELSQNDIGTMSDNSLAGLTTLETLNLDSQKSSQLTLPLMSSLTSLTTLVLENTVITQPSWDKLKQAASLRTLRMKQGQISAIPPLTFQLMTNLEYVDFSSNQLTQINQETFVGPRNTLSQIYLNSNSISTFDLCTFFSYQVNVKLELYQNPLRCDCKLSWLLDAVKSGRVLLNELTTCEFPSALNGKTFTSLNSSQLCQTEPDVPTCIDYYSTTTSTTPAPPTTPSENIQITVVAEVNVNSATISWTINKLDSVEEVKVIHTDIQTQEQGQSRSLSPTLAEYTITELKAGTLYQFCVEAIRSGAIIKEECRSYTTRSLSTTPDPNANGQTSNNDQLGIIIGAVIGGLVLFAILVAIIYLVFIRKKPPQDKYAVEPKNFKSAGVPTTGYDSKRYRKKKKDETDGKKNSVNVTVISDGKSGPNIGRASVGSYQYLQDNKGVSGKPDPSYVNDVAARDNYENDQSLRTLPQLPRDSAGYYSHSPNNPADQQPHMYSEIKL